MLRGVTILFLFVSSFTFAQSKIFGVQVKPIIPVNYFNAGPVSFSDTLLNMTLAPKLGYSFGMVMRTNFTKKLSLETGINYVRRNYSIAAKEKIRDTSDYTDFGFVSYEIPIQGLVYIRISDKVYMNASSGVGVNFYASNVMSIGENLLITHFSSRNKWVNLSFLANLGFEYRSKDEGWFYVGASLVTPFSFIMTTDIDYYYTDNRFKKYQHNLNGNYLTLDFRYFFNEKNEKKRN